MLARIRRPILLFLAASVAALASAVPSSASPTVRARVRTDPGPTARHVFGTGTTVGRASGSPITVRSSTTRPAAPPSPDGLAEGAAPLVPVPTTHFDAIPRIGGNWPGDPTGAMGTTNVVTAVNTHVAVYAPDGTQLLAPTPLADLGFPLRTQIFDPRVVYDQYADTFVLVYLAVNDSQQRSWIVATTIPDATAADQSTWCAVKLRGDGVAKNGPQWADYPALGYDADSVAISTNAFNFLGRGAFAYAQVYHIANTELFATCDPADPVTFTPFAQEATRDPDGTKAFTLQPAQTVGASNGDQYFLSFERAGRTSALVVWRLRETATLPTLTRSELPVAKASISPYGTQQGGAYNDDDTWWDPGDLRLVNAFYDADLDRLYAAHVIFKDLQPDAITGGYPEAAIRWYEVDPGGRLKGSDVTSTGIVGTPETDAGWPVVATDAAGNLFVTYSRASKPMGEYLSAWAAEIPPGSRTAELALLTAGTARMEALNGVERWGDFNAINRDPVDGAFVAMVNQYAKSDGSGTTTQDWQQTFDLVTHG